MELEQICQGAKAASQKLATLGTNEKIGLSLQSHPPLSPHPPTSSPQTKKTLKMAKKTICRKDC